MEFEPGKALEWIEARISEGRTVYISTHLRATKVTPKNYRDWKENHGGLFRVNGKWLEMRSGKRWDAINYSKITAA